MHSEMNILNNSALYIDRQGLRENLRSILAHLPEGTALIPVLKSDAFGLGETAVMQTISTLEQITCIAVAHVSEGVHLRKMGWQRGLLMLGSALPGQLEAALDADITLTVGRLGLVPELVRLGQERGISVPVQIKIDTGLHRIGLEPGEDLEQLIGELSRAGEQIRVQGAFSHFSDPGDPERMRQQHARYLAGVEQLERAGIPIPMRHMSGSEAFEYAPEYHMDAVRLGRGLFFDHPTRPRGIVKEIASWRTFITGVKLRRAGDTLGYGEGFRLERDTLVATIGVGYGDGLDQKLVQTHAPVLVQGKRCPLLSCCMDQSMIDVTGLDCAPGEEVTLFGYDGKGGCLSAQEVSLLIGDGEGCGLTVQLSGRVARVYTGEV